MEGGAAAPPDTSHVPPRPRVASRGAPGCDASPTPLAQAASLNVSPRACALPPRTALKSPLSPRGALRNPRQLAAHTLRPKARGRSLTAVSLIHGDPAGRPGYAASARWALEARRAAAHDADALGTPYLTHAHYATRADAVPSSGRTAKGPSPSPTLSSSDSAGPGHPRLRVCRLIGQHLPPLPRIPHHRPTLTTPRHAQPPRAATRANT